MVGLITDGTGEPLSLRRRCSNPPGPMRSPPEPATSASFPVHRVSTRGTAKGDDPPPCRTTKFEPWIIPANPVREDGFGFSAYRLSILLRFRPVPPLRRVWVHPGAASQTTTLP